VNGIRKTTYEEMKMLTKEELDIVQKLYGSGAIFSFVGSGFIVVSYLLFKEFRTLTTLLIFFLGISDLGLATTNLLTWFYVYPGRISNDHLNMICLAQAYGMQYFAICSFLWTSCIACHAYLTLKIKLRKSVLTNYFKLYFAICFCLPTIPLIVGYFKNIYGATESHMWCWIKAEHVGLRFGFYYGPLVLFWLINFIVYILLSRTDSLAYSYLMKEGRKKLRLYLLVLILCKLPALANRLANAISDNPIYALVLLQALFDSLFGFFDSMVYGIFKARINILKRKLLSCFGSDANNSKRFDYVNSRVYEHKPLIQNPELVPKPYSSISERLYSKKAQNSQLGVSLENKNSI